MYSMTIYAFFESPSASDEDMLFCFDASFLTAHLKLKSGMFDSMLSGREPHSMPEMEPVAMSVSKLPSFFNDPHVRRVSAINLSRLKCELGKALGIDWGPQFLLAIGSAEMLQPCRVCLPAVSVPTLFLHVFCCGMLQD